MATSTTESDALDRADMERLQRGEDDALNDLMDRHAAPQELIGPRGIKCPRLAHPDLHLAAMGLQVESEQQARIPQVPRQPLGIVTAN